MNGKIVRMVSNRNFGFIQSTVGKEYFFHRDDINGHWEEFVVGESVTFEEAPMTEKGPRAYRVMLDNQYD